MGSNPDEHSREMIIERKCKGEHDQATRTNQTHQNNMRPSVVKGGCFAKEKLTEQKQYSLTHSQYFGKRYSDVAEIVILEYFQK